MIAYDLDKMAEKCPDIIDGVSYKAPNFIR